jgi:hypothetical protein
LRVIGVFSRSWAHVRTSALALTLMLSHSQIPESSFCDIILPYKGAVYTFACKPWQGYDICDIMLRAVFAIVPQAERKSKVTYLT